MDIMKELRRKCHENLKRIYGKYGKFIYYQKSRDDFIDKEFEEKILEFLRRKFPECKMKMIWEKGYKPVVILLYKNFEIEITGEFICLEDEIWWDGEKFEWEPWVENLKEKLEILKDILRRLGYKISHPS